MSGWLFSVFSAVMIISVLSLLLSEGKMGKFVKPFVSLAVLIIIITPFTSLNGVMDGENSLYHNLIETDKEYLYKTALAKIDVYTDNCVKIAEKNGITDCAILIEYNIDDNGALNIFGVGVNLKNAVITENKEHIVILQSLINELSKYLQIEKTGVKIIE